MPYYHLVFTLPHELNGWARLHPDKIYRLLFQAAWQTVSAFSKKHRKLTLSEKAGDHFKLFITGYLSDSVEQSKAHFHQPENRILSL